MPNETELEFYRDGWADALIWVLNHLNLDPDDEDRVKEILDA